jgi:hypothetical protein
MDDLRAHREQPDAASPEAEALRLLGPLAERRVAVYHAGEVAAVARALEAAWIAAAPPALLAALRSTPGGARLLAPAVLLEDDALVLAVSAPAAVCAAFDERSGRLDSHSEFGR